jgi:1,4-dihydroxy-2-naphthoyl-CoA hydrolase
MADDTATIAVRQFQAMGEGKLPGLLGLELVSAAPDRFECRFDVTERHLAPNGYLHAASVIALADTLCGYAAGVSLPKGAVGFTTAELKSNFLATARSGGVRAFAEPMHRGRTTQVWDARVLREDDTAVIALFRCTQLILWPKS